jgi:hypothetical protein
MALVMAIAKVMRTVIATLTAMATVTERTKVMAMVIVTATATGWGGRW